METVKTALPKLLPPIIAIVLSLLNVTPLPKLQDWGGVAMLMEVLSVIAGTACGHIFPFSSSRNRDRILSFVLSLGLSILFLLGYKLYTDSPPSATFYYFYISLATFLYCGFYFLASTTLTASILFVLKNIEKSQGLTGQ